MHAAAIACRPDLIGGHDMAQKSLVAYFSATGTTRELAKRLAKATGADLFEITPTEPYTAADLDWRNENSRSSVEMHDPSSRPTITGMPKKLDSYDVVYVGFPIWWYTAPQIVKTFLESGDFTGKSIALFATSGSSGMGDTLEALVPCSPDAWWLGADRFDANASVGELKEWVEDLGL